MLWIILCLVAAASLVGAVVINKRLLGDNAAEENVTSLYFIVITLILTPVVFLLVPISDFSLLSAEIISAAVLIAILNALSVYIYMKAIILPIVLQQL